MRTEGGAKLYAVFIDVFSSTLPDNEIDGQIMIMSEKDVKEIVKPLGQVKRIMRLQSSLKDETLQAPDQGSNVCTIRNYYAILFQRFTVTVKVIACILPTQMSQTLPSSSTPSTSTTPSSSPVPNPACSKQVVEIPQLWRPSIMSAIQCKQLTSDVRYKISCDLIMLL